MQVKYHITRRLGQGGMAEVFAGELTGDLGFTRKVAIKRMLAEAAADPSAAQRFLDEARIASRLHHANIVGVLDVGLLEGLPFQVLELVEGLDAHQVMSRAGGKVPIEIALLIASDVAHALDHAHTATDAEGVPLGIVHRDVKPSNILLSWAGDVKLTDFGIAVARIRTTKTEAGLVAGTQGFMSPEQRSQGIVDGRSDVYALALTLHVLLTGRSPLQDPGVELAVLMGDPVPLAAELPADVLQAIAKALAFQRLERPSAKQFAETLAGLAAFRATRDRRSLVQAYMEAQRAATPRRGALDQLLGLDLVLTAGLPGVDASYELAPGEAATVKETPKARALEVPAPPSLPVITIEPASRRTSRVIVAGAVVAAALGGGAWWKLQGHAATQPVKIVAASTLDAPPLLKPAADAQLAFATPSDAALPPPDAEPPTHTGTLRPHVHHDDAHARTRPDPSSGQPPATDVGTGFLQVVGEDVIGGKVFVDGVMLGYPPKKIEVRRGKHAVVVEKRDGTRLPARDVEITDLQTLANPARLTW